MTENLHPEGEEESTLLEGNESGADDFSWLEDDTVTDEVKLKVVNELEGRVQPGRQYKTLEDYEKSRKEALKAFSQQGRTPKVESPSTPVSDVEEMFFDMKPEAELVKSDLEMVAKAKGITLIQAWKQETWLHEKSSILSKEAQQRQANARKVIPPSSSAGTGSVPYADLSDDEILSLSPEEAEKAFKAKAGR